nr:putative ribonuclease H-like domain-containing protein [Tanacetum cinerariifolium]
MKLKYRRSLIQIPRIWPLFLSQRTAVEMKMSNGSQIKFEDINPIDEDDMEEIDIKWNMALKESYRQGSKAEEKTPKALMAIDGVGWDWSYMKNNNSLNSKIKDLTGELSEANNYIYHYKLAVAQLEGRLVAYKEREVKYIEKIRTLEMYRASNLKCIKTLDKELEELKLEKDGLDGKLAGLLKASKNLDNLIESQRPDKVKEGVGYNAVPPPATGLYLSPKKDLSWTGLPEFVDDTVIDYSRPSPTVASTSAGGQNKDSSTSEDVASPNTPKPFVKFVKPKASQSKRETNKQETPKKPQVKYAKQYRHSNKKPNVKGNQRNWNNLKSYQLRPEKRVQREITRSQKYAYESPSHKSGGHRPHGAPMRPQHKSVGHIPHGPSMRLSNRPTGHRPHGAPMRPQHKSVGHIPHGPSMRLSNRPTGHRPHGPSMNPIRPYMNSARPNRSFFIQAPSYETRPFFKSSTVKTPYRALWVPTVNRNNPPVNRKFSTGRRNFPTVNWKFSTASRKFPTGSTKVHTADMGRKGKAVKPSACWTWNPSQKLSNKGPINNSVSVMFKKYTYINTQGRLNGCSRHMTSNISYLSDFEPFDGGYVSFGQGGCKITGNGTIKTGKLEFENVYFIKDLKYNLFSVSQICDNKNSVLFTDAECIVLGRNFKLLDDANILLRTPRQHNMYSISLNNIVLHKDLTCLVAKASTDECILWHRRLVYQMDVKSVFLYGTIDEEVYVMQPPRFQDPAFPAKVYKVEKVMYGLHQAPRAWYGTLSKYLLKNSFQRGTLDQTLFIIRQREDFILVQVYVDDIIFGSSNPQLCREFEALMHEKFQMSAMGELNFFLGLQVLQKEDGIFLSQDKYIGDILKKFGYSDVKSSNTLMDKENPWGKDGTRKDVDLHLYRSMIRSLMYLTASRQDIMFAVSACARHQVIPKELQVLEDREGVAAKQSGDDALIKRRSINEGEAANERISNDSNDIARVLTSMDAATVLAGGIDVPTSSGSIPNAGPPATVISTGSKVGPTASPIVTSYSRRKGKEVMAESDTLEKQRLQEQIDAQVSRELEEQQEKEDMRMNEQIARDAEVARIHAKEELQGMIDSLDKSNETIAKYLKEYQEFASELPLEKRIELISDLVKFQENYFKVKDFKGMTFEEIEAKFAEVWKQVEDFIPMGSKEEAERLKRKGLNLEQEHVKKQKSSEEAPEMEKSTEEITEEKMKEMMQLRSYWKIIRLGGSSACYQFFIDLLKQLNREDLNQLWDLVKEYLSIRLATSEKEMELWVELKRLYEPDPEDEL